MKLPVNLTAPLMALVLLGGCLGGGHSPVIAESRIGPAADYPVVIGVPYAIEGVTHTPSDAMNSDAVGYAVAGDEGGEAISIAHKTLPLPSYAEVTSLESGKTILVRVERRGPMTNERLVELSPGAASQLGLLGVNQAPIRIRRVNPPEIERAMLRSGQRAPDRMDTPQSLLTVLKRKLDPQMSASVAATTPASVAATAPRMPPPTPAPTVQPEVPQTKVQTSEAQVVQAVPDYTNQADSGSAIIQALPADYAPATAKRGNPTRAASNRSAQIRKSASGTGPGLYVQVGAFANQQNAAAASAKLGATIRSARNLSRVVMGPYGSRSEAQAALAKARQAGYSDARIQSAR